MVTFHSANFGYLEQHDAQLVRQAVLAERFFQDDPNTSLIKLRQFAELLAQQIAARTNSYSDPSEPFVDLLRRLYFERILPREISDLFHKIRKSGNAAAHELAGTHQDALNSLCVARALAIWFHRTFSGESDFDPGVFVPPPDPAASTKELEARLEELREALEQSRSEAEKAHAKAEQEVQARLDAEQRATKTAEDRKIWENLAEEAEAASAASSSILITLQEKAQQEPRQVTLELIETGHKAAQSIDLDEADTRTIIDQKLRDRRWDADSVNLRYSKGTRPARGRYMAIAEWPTASGPADYAFFIGTQLIALAEAKRKRKNVSAAIDQAERYARGFKWAEGTEAIGGPWDKFLAPFVFASNGRPYLKQLETESGIWFRDVRKSSNHRRALSDWPTPDGLRGWLEFDRETAHEALITQPLEFGFPLRPYQKSAIVAAEAALEKDA